MDQTRLLDTLKQDEGFSSKSYWDKKQWTYGYGCKAPGEGATITREAAKPLLEEHLDTAIAGFKRMFRGHEYKFNEVREEAFIQLIFNMGTGRPDGNEGLYSFKNTLGFIFKNSDVPWASVADGLQRSLWFRQVGKSGDPDGPGPKEGRGERIVRQVRTGVF
ncbi:hypothetical protein [Geobacter sp. SVR]|uniref:glycoside hydrolase family protein n=1 Tax=Geobacter sp. SVR TaxID=2495594 RepID=UPI00143F0381|nr:hypothetical protein [Geobacter sp. SVR]BCS54791.1 hypothetical protein GSVR_30990 [Geobacter sp. SVR]GCF86401.1 hypothetical protein GSbR_30010 [Geobacter sp. SVR]